MKQQPLVYVGDFETTVYDNQETTEVWASALVQLGSEEVVIHHSIGEAFEFLKRLKRNVVVYYHNLKFDGNFWLSYLLCNLKYTQAYATDSNGKVLFWKDKKDMDNKSVRYSISDMGMWYTVTIKVNNQFIELRDSLKLLPFSVAKIGKSFKTKHQKLDMEYKGFRYPGCTITQEERKYIANDVLVVKEALEIMFGEGHKKLTIGSCCLAEYRAICKTSTKNLLDYDEMFPDLTTIQLDESQYGVKTVDAYIRRSYKGGWCYLVKGKENQEKHNGTTADVNSLYPSMMSSESGNKYPVGVPHFWKGDYIPDVALKEENYYFIRVRTRFYLKPGKLPFIQIKGNIRYKGTEALERSDIYDAKTGTYKRWIKDINGNIIDSSVTLTLTMTDWELIKEHYELVDCEILDGVWFLSQVGIFDEYIDKYKKIKMNSTGALRELAKLFLNNLYGKLSSSTRSDYKVAYIKEDGSIAFEIVEADDKTAGYIPCGSAITSYARNFTIRSAQQNYYGKDKPGFIYADTDSIHCDLPPEQIKGIRVDDKEFCCWKLESCWDVAIFTRQKTYIEHVTHENLQPIEQPYYNIKCAGMPQRCKDLFEASMSNKKIDKPEKLTEEQKQFLKVKRTLKDFKIGLHIPGKLMPKRIKGGVLLVETTYEMR